MCEVTSLCFGTNRFTNFGLRPMYCSTTKTSSSIPAFLHSTFRRSSGLIDVAQSYQCNRPAGPLVEGNKVLWLSHGWARRPAWCFEPGLSAPLEAQSKMTFCFGPVNWVEKTGRRIVIRKRISYEVLASSSSQTKLQTFVMVWESSRSYWCKFTSSNIAVQFSSWQAIVLPAKFGIFEVVLRELRDRRIITSSIMSNLFLCNP